MVPMVLSFGGVACQTPPLRRTTSVSRLISGYLANCVGMVLRVLGWLAR